MSKKTPLYPHAPKSRNTAPRVPGQSQDITLRFLPDSPEVMAETITGARCRENLGQAFRQAIARVQGGK